MKHLLFLLLLPGAAFSQCIDTTIYYSLKMCGRAWEDSDQGVIGWEATISLYDEQDQFVEFFLLNAEDGSVCDTTELYEHMLFWELTDVSVGHVEDYNIRVEVLIDTFIEITYPDTIRDTIYSLFPEIVEDFSDPCNPKVTYVLARGPEGGIRIPDKLPGYNYYIPNAIHPRSNNGENRVLRVYSPDTGLLIKDWKIFDKWGNLQWNIKNTPASEAYWDGICRGQMGNKDVYVSIIELEFSSGKKEFVKNDVTLF